MPRRFSWRHWSLKRGLKSPLCAAQWGAPSALFWADPSAVAEPGGATLDAGFASAGAVRLSGEARRIGVKTLLCVLDEDEIGDGEQDQRGEDLPRQCGEP